VTVLQEEAATRVREERSIGQLLRELGHETNHLLRQELELAKTEMSEKASRVGADVGKIAVGGAIAFAGALALLFTLIRGLTALLALVVPLGVAVWLAPLLIGAVFVGIGYAFARNGLDRLRHEQIKPTKTTQSLQENKEWLRTKLT
jgi:hypothetical protein